MVVFPYHHNDEKFEEVKFNINPTQNMYVCSPIYMGYTVSRK
jgi:hypothetical protein